MSTQREAVHLPAVIALLGATAVWGSTFLVTKDSLDTLSVANLLFWRFGIAALVLLAVAPGRWLHLTTTEWRRGILLGLFLGSGFLAQTEGLRHTSAAVSGFLTGLMVVFTPLVAAALFSERITRRGWMAVAVATAGLGLISFNGFSLSPGSAITVLGALLFSLQIASLSRWATRENSYGLTAVSVAVTAAVCLVAAALGDGVTTPARTDEWVAILYLALGATCLGLVLQAWSQSHLTATTAAVIMTLEPAFAAIIAVGIGGEVLTDRMWLGATAIVAAMFIAELGPRECCDAEVPRVQAL
ncbi:MAG: DMT family transporter [Actinobacteria bacterium]|nr:DMT family transporter [Actinomycetota bacterium]MCB0921345.1 DMT family transporter [Actinomycetota bacterium]